MVLESELELTVEFVVKKGTRECQGKTGMGLASLQATKYKQKNYDTNSRKHY